MNKAPIITVILFCGILVSLPFVMFKKEKEKEEKKYNELPLTAGTVVEKVEINTQKANTMFLIDTDNNKDTIEKMMFVSKDSIQDLSLTSSIKEGSQIKFKDRYKNSTKLLSIDIYQIDDLIANQR